jgi:hypothetical protein
MDRWETTPQEARESPGTRGPGSPTPQGGGGEPHETGDWDGSVSRGRRIAGSIQDYVAVGYLYLLVLGIASDSLFYGALGINIIRYSTVLDVLLSPVIHLTDQLAFPLVIFGIPLLGLAITRLFVRRAGGEVPIQIGGKVRARVTPMTFWVGFSGMVIFSAYLGLGLGGGQAVKQALEQGSLTMDHRLTFQDGSVADVRMVGNNSIYAFYVVEGARVVSVSPIHENIRSIEAIPRER